MEVMKRTGVSVLFEIEKLQKAIERAMRHAPSFKEESNLKSLTEGLLIEYVCITDNSLDQALNQISNKQLNEMQNTIKNILKMIGKFDWDDWYKDYQKRVAKHLQKKVTKVLRKRWREANIAAIKESQFIQFAMILLKKGIAILSNPALRTFLDFIKIAIELKKLLPKSSKRKSFKAFEIQSFQRAFFLQ